MTLNDILHVLPSLNASAVVTLVGLVVPLVTGFLVSPKSPGWFKSLVTFVLTIINGSVGALVGINGGYDWKGFEASIVLALVSAAASWIVVTKNIGGPQLQQIGLQLGEWLAHEIDHGKHEAGHVVPVDPGAGTSLPLPDVPPTGNVAGPHLSQPKGDAGYAPVGFLGYLLIVLGVVGLVLGLLGRHVAEMASCAGFLIPGIVLLVVGIVLWLLGSYGPGPWRRV